MRAGAMADIFWRVCKGIAHKPTVTALLLVLVCAIVTLPGLGVHGFVDSEAHRAVPGFEMADSGNWWVPTMFGQTYLRKPPAMPQLIAVSSGVFGDTEFAARFVSACAWTNTVLVIWMFACRWFGRVYGLYAAMACVLWPWFWYTARSAEIEALHNMFSVLTVLSLADMLVWQKRMSSHDRARSYVRAGVCASAIAIGVSGMFASKGGAGFAAVGGALIGPMIVRRRWRARLEPRESIRTIAVVMVCVLVGTASITWLWLRHYIVISSQDAVTQSTAHFLWDMDKLQRILIIVGDAFVAGTPWSFAALWPWGAFARRESNRAVVSGSDIAAHDRLAIAQAVALACVAGLVLSMVAGVSNVRYTMPVVMPVCVLVAYCTRGWCLHFARVRRAFWRVNTFGSPTLVCLICTAALAVWSVQFEHRRAYLSGRAIGSEVGAAIRSDMVDRHVSRAAVLADHLVEARPEILLAVDAVSGVDVRWRSGLPDVGTFREVNATVYLALRDDADSCERAAMMDRGVLESATTIGEWQFREYRIIVYRLDPYD